jgi:hypothetical protein
MMLRLGSGHRFHSAYLIFPQVFSIGGYFYMPTQPDQSYSIKSPRHSSSSSPSPSRDFGFYTTIMLGLQKSPRTSCPTCSSPIARLTSSKYCLKQIVVFEFIIGVPAVDHDHHWHHHEYVSDHKKKALEGRTSVAKTSVPIKVKKVIQYRRTVSSYKLGTAVNGFDLTGSSPPGQKSHSSQL